MYTIHGEYGPSRWMTISGLLIRDDWVERRPDLARRAGVQSVPSHWMSKHKEGSAACSIISRAPCLE